MKQIIPDIFFCCDALEYLKYIADESVDLVCTDPPYSLTQRGNEGNSGGVCKDRLFKKGKVFKDNNVDIENWLPDVYRVLKDGTHCYIMVNNLNLTHYLKVIDHSDFHFIRLLVWDKHNMIMGTKYMGQVEFIIMCSKGTSRNINYCGTSDLISIPISKLKDKNGKNLHDTEKPIGLMSTLIMNSTNEEDLVLDPFAGIGSTCIAAKKLHRHYIGFEINEKYAKIAMSRLKEQTLW